jgi:hypothetical protein
MFKVKNMVVKHPLSEVDHFTNSRLGEIGQNMKDDDKRNDKYGLGGLFKGWSLKGGYSLGYPLPVFRAMETDALKQLCREKETILGAIDAFGGAAVGDEFKNFNESVGFWLARYRLLSVLSSVSKKDIKSVAKQSELTKIVKFVVAGGQIHHFEYLLKLHEMLTDIVDGAERELLGMKSVGETNIQSDAVYRDFCCHPKHAAMRRLIICEARHRLPSCPFGLDVSDMYVASAGDLRYLYSPTTYYLRNFVDVLTFQGANWRNTSGYTELDVSPELNLISRVIHANLSSLTNVNNTTLKQMRARCKDMLYGQFQDKIIADGWVDRIIDLIPVSSGSLN